SGVLPPRKHTAHKGAFGPVLVVGGNLGMPGAVRLAGEAALRSGGGLVSVATRPEHVNGLVAGRPELMCCGIKEASDIEPLLARASVIAVGPGLGKDQWAQGLLQKILKSPLPVVADADALNLLAEKPAKRDSWVITPHPGEAGRLLKMDTASVQADRYAAVERLSKDYSAVAVLKGAGSLVKHPDKTTWVCHHGNPGMATAGMGDVLTGIIAGLIAQGLSLPDAARAGVLLHAKAADAAAEGGERGLLASDLMPFLRRQVNRMQ
ncbi:MAG: NAD(P)H-hydrate dehydratase, partial [Gammaproteobacteria bacterium]|nr:NAD(P)H-hydrate dehydratase [Gammaproteobacteria bacterium]